MRYPHTMTVMTRALAVTTYSVTVCMALSGALRCFWFRECSRPLVQRRSGGAL